MVCGLQIIWGKMTRNCGLEVQDCVRSCLVKGEVRAIISLGLEDGSRVTPGVPQSGVTEK